MTASLVLLTVAVWWGGAAGDLPPPARSYRILMLLPASPPSHRNIFIPLAEALADRGHKVEVLSSLPDFPTLRDIRQLDSGLKIMELQQLDMFSLLDDSEDDLSFFLNVLPPLAARLYKSAVVMDTYNRRKEFDLFILDHMCNEMAYPFVHEMAFITIATLGMDPHQSAMFGNVLNPAYTPWVMRSIPPPWTIYKRFSNLLMHILIPILYDYFLVLPKIQKEISSHFPDLPPLLGIQRNQSLTLINSHFSLDVPHPLLPSQVQVAAIHCRPGRPLPQDIKSWIDGAGEAGVVYFSLGSVTKGTTMPAKYRDLFVQAFKRLDQRVIWKFEGALPGLSENVLLRPWFPQQDVLSDPHVRLFISHGGLLGMEEAIYHKKPILALPIYGDQPRNAQNIASKGLGLYLNWKELTADLLVQSIQEILNNTRYNRRLQEVSAILRDQAETPQERAVFWTEYVIRYRGAPHLRSPAAQLSWVEFLMLDVLFFLLLAALMTCLVLRKILTLIRQRAFGIQPKIKND